MAINFSTEHLYGYMADLPADSIATFYEVLPLFRGTDRLAYTAIYGGHKTIYPPEEYSKATKEILDKGVTIQRLRGLPEPSLSGYIPRAIGAMARIAEWRQQAGEDVRVIKIGKQIIEEVRHVASIEPDAFLTNFAKKNTGANFWTFEVPQSDSSGSLALVAVAQALDGEDFPFRLETGQRGLEEVAEGIAFWEQRYDAARAATEWRALYRTDPQIVQSETPELVRAI